MNTFKTVCRCLKITDVADDTPAWRVAEKIIDRWDGGALFPAMAYYCLTEIAGDVSYPDDEAKERIAGHAVRLLSEVDGGRFGDEPHVVDIRRAVTLA